MTEMNKLAIKAENLSKVYRIGDKEEKNDTLIGSIGSLIKRPIKNYRKIKGLTHLGENSKNQNDIIWALKDISFEIKKGEVVGVIGANGAGKSTLLKILSRITAPTQGKITISGKISSLLEVGTGFHPELTGRENIYLNGTILGLSKKEIGNRFDEIIDFSGVEKFIDTPVKRFSSGMRLRLAFSVAAHLEPEILLIDEVLAVGDNEFQKKCIGKMEHFSQSGRTVLFVSHNLGLIRNICQKAILLKSGVLDTFSNVENCIKKYTKENRISLEKSADERIGLHNIRINNVIINKNLPIYTGKSLSIEFDLQHVKNDAKPTMLAISIWDKNDTKLISLDTDLIGGIKNKNFKNVSCLIEKVQLVKGDYWLNIHVESDFGIEDYILKEHLITVNSGIFNYQTIPPKELWGFFAIEHNWKVY